MSVWIFLAVFGTAGGLSALLTPLAIHVGKRWEIVDVPGGRRKHKGRIVRLGGLALYPAFLGAILVAQSFHIPTQDPLEKTRLVGVLLGLGLVWAVGLLDDFRHLSFWPQVGGLVLAAFVAILFKVFIELFNNPFTNAQVKVNWYIMVPLTLFWIVGMTGTMNVLDGLDGLATGVSAIASLVLFLHMLRLRQESVALLPLALLGVCIGFLPYNFSPAKIFLGGGAYVLGYAVATLSIVAGAKVATALLVLWLPILDAAWQVYCRWRRGQPISLGDRGHLHFRLQDLGWPTKRIVLFYYSITALLGAVALLCPSRALKLAILAGVGAFLLLALAVLTRLTGNNPDVGQ
ncbi:MAG: undecaprenyl/decaprenyl-phosphate alpha-N-acetylglucosaminyl 1-phosphate transferase [Anaerolineae bacterium]|nr:undecaprenyl/decaprenyl-phosphate alpha-N-acetylglucosaminyl 1-phosphate transferase [Anaerolineae bacterium]